MKRRARERDLAPGTDWSGLTVSILLGLVGLLCAGVAGWVLLQLGAGRL